MTETVLTDPAPGAASSLRIVAAEVVLPCTELDPTVTFFTERLGFRVDMVMPADDPSVAVLSGYGVRIRLQRGAGGEPGALRLRCQGGGDQEWTAPNGTRIAIVDVSAPLVIPDSVSVFELTRPDGDIGGVGRAGMHYRDLLPSRQGGRFIASHVVILEGGPVPDYVHHHNIRFQMIYCAAGWVRLVYQDQGEPFVLAAGDCVLQPPHIRHQVLESSPGLEVIEIGCPAAHETGVDHEISLPTSDVRPDRDFGGQRFVRHHAASAQWEPWRLTGFECRDTGIGAATDGLAGARVVRGGASTPERVSHDGELQFWYVLSGSAVLDVDGRDPEQLAKAVAVAVPAGLPYSLGEPSSDLEFLEVTLPATVRVERH